MKPVKMHFFNPGHETAVLVNSGNYTAPANVRVMMNDLSLLPAWYAEPGDWVLTDHPGANEYLNVLPEEIAPAISIISLSSSLQRVQQVPPCIATPWGISPHSLQVFRKLKKEKGLPLTIPEWKTEYYEMTGRYTGHKVIAALCNSVPEIEATLTPWVCKDLTAVKHYMAQLAPPYVIKTPFSSSGRGILWITSAELSGKDITWIVGAINRQGAVSIEQGLNKVVDFAMEFYSDGKGNIIYKGLSVFSTGERGAYSSNILMSQDHLYKHPETYIQRDKLNRIVEELIVQLQVFYGNRYAGYLGVDMMIYEKGEYYLHPCVEINMRYTMGLVAIQVFDKLIAQHSKGMYQVAYFKEKGEAQRFNDKMSNKYPLKVVDGKITAGYLSLCPVEEVTHYIAYIVIE
ncbi:MAG: hypothetical protein LIO97_13225 [Tannerellaceae bacterium]|nr:hypothetical protein [Tannerellaceae bacterium]